MSDYKAESNIWNPGVYEPRTDGDYARTISDISLDEITELVQQRAKTDGEWTIENGLVGNNEILMRRMMEFVADPKNIQQCTAYIYAEDTEYERTVDWVCRELANASKIMIR